MKHGLAIFIVFLLSSCGGQKGNTFTNYHRNFPFTYYFTLDYKNDSSSFQTSMQTIDDKLAKISGKVMDVKNRPLTFPFWIILKNKLNQSFVSIELEENGEFEMTVPQGEYDFRIQGNGFYDPLLTEVQLENGKELILDIQIGRLAQDEVYELHSIAEMTEEEILEIKNCEENKHPIFDKKKDCVDREKCVLIIQI